MPSLRFWSRYIVSEKISRYERTARQLILSVTASPTMLMVTGS